MTNKLKFITHNDDDLIGIGGTCYQDTLIANYADLVDTFGEPMDGDNYKTDAEWTIRFTVGETEVVATIYNWKNGKNYCGEEDGLDVTEIREWNVGGFDANAPLWVKTAMEGTV